MVIRSPIDERLSRSEEQFLHAIAVGGVALSNFQDEWATLLADIDYEAKTNHVDNATTTFRSVVASRVLLLSEHLLNFQVDADVMESTFEAQLESIFARVDISDNDISNRTPSTPASGSSDICHSPQDRITPSYIELAYKWLLNNLHDPYPSKEIRNSIHVESGISRKGLDAWFIDARKRIGWNTLRRQHFSNKRVDIVEAATRFFLQGGAERTLDLSIDPTPNLDIEFVSIETRAKDLYSDKFSESTLAAVLDVSVKDLTPEAKAEARSAGKARRQREREAKYQVQQDAQAASSYPSPARSISGTPEPTVLPPIAADDIPTVEMIFRSKKRNNDEVENESPNKRFRYGTFPLVSSFNLRFHTRCDVPHFDLSNASLPSPALSEHNPLPTVDNSLPALPTTISIPSISGRKRRLSDANGQGLPKRPRNLPVSPRLHAVSDPLPTSDALSAWFQDTFGIPSDLCTEELGISIPLDIELYQYTTSDIRSYSSVGKFDQCKQTLSYVICFMFTLMYIS
jgi:hypothetical protein